MKNHSSARVRLLTLTIVGVALLFGGCAFWDDVMKGSVCVYVTLPRFVTVTDVNKVLEALQRYSPNGNLYYVVVRNNQNGSGDFHRGNKELLKCCTDHRGKGGPIWLTGFTNVTQVLKYDSTKSEAEFEALIDELRGLQKGR